MLCEVFSDQAGYVVVGMAKNATEAVQMEHDTRPDVVVIDLIMPYIDGSQLLSMLDDRPSLVKVVLSASTAASQPMRARLIALGASAFFDKREIAANPERFRQQIAGLLLSRALRRSPDAAGPTPGATPGTTPATNKVIGTTTDVLKPCDEQERVALLAKLGVANMDQDYCLDILARHLATQTGFPIVAVTLVGEEQVWTKSGVAVERMVVPRVDSICSRAICDARPTIISDLSASPATRDLPFVANAPHFRSYAGAPIVLREGVTLGMMCMMDTRPRQPTPAAVKSLVDAAALAARFIEDVPAALRSAA